MKQYPSKFNTSFDDNKHAVVELTKGTTTRIRNQTAGYITRTIALAQASSAAESDMDEQEEMSE